MKWHTLKYLFKEGLIGLWKNRLMAIASIVTIVLCLSILGASFFITQNIQYVLEQVESEIGITAYIDEGVGEERIQEIERQIRTTNGITEVSFVSKEQALKNFSMSQNNSELFDDFKDDNPLPASFEMKVEEIGMQHDIVRSLEQIPELQVAYFEKEAEIFTSMNSSLQLISVGIVGTLIIVALLLISNTIKLTVYIRRKEINIMKYIGATDVFIRLPFLVEGFIIGCIGAIIPTLVITRLYDTLYELSVGGLKSLMGSLEIYPTAIIMSELAPMFAAIGISIGVIGSMVAIRQHLRV